MGVHTSIHVDGDTYEWAYGGKSRSKSTHDVQYRGIIYEKPKQFLYGDWEHWKSVPVGTGRSLCAANDKVSLRNARKKLKELVGANYADSGYHWIRNNCWKFCYDLLATMDIHIPSDTIENLNDERLGIFTGCTYMAFHYIVTPLSRLLGLLVEALVVFTLSERKSGKDPDSP